MNHKLEAHELSEACVMVMTDWWFDRFIGKDQYKDNGADDPQSTMAGIMGGMLADKHPVEESQRHDFRTAFAAALQGCLPNEYTLHFGADYHPNGILREAMEAANIDSSRCPIKTSMEVGHDERGSGVYLSAGYGAPLEFICDLQGLAPTRRRVCTYTSVYEKYETRNGTEVEESRHDRIFYAYDERAWEEFRGGDNWDSCPEGSYIKVYLIFVSEHVETRRADGEWGAW